MKFKAGLSGLGTAFVAPFTGAWIEIPPTSAPFAYSGVAPFTGAWIEITLAASAKENRQVAPFTGAWIEILLLSTPTRCKVTSRTLHGCVD